MTSLAIYLLGLGLVAVVAWVVAAPLLRGVAGLPPEPPEERSRWQKQKSEALAGIRDAEFDFHLGKLSESDYREMRRTLEAKALEAIRNVDAEAGKKS